MATSDPMARKQRGQRQCSATSKQTGKPCTQPAIPGGTVCRFHGGSAPQVVRSARQRLDALVDPAIEGLAVALKTGEVGEIIKASQIVLDRCGYGPKSEMKIELDEGVEAAVRLVGQVAAEFIPEEKLEAFRSRLEEIRREGAKG